MLQGAPAAANGRAPPGAPRTGCRGTPPPARPNLRSAGHDRWPREAAAVPVSRSPAGQDARPVAPVGGQLVDPAVLNDRHQHGLVLQDTYVLERVALHEQKVSQVARPD